MAIYPGGTFKPTSQGGHTPRRKGQRGILHVAVSNATDLPPWNGNTWHFYVNRLGQAFQYVDTDWCAWASVEANGDAISIETQGGMGTSAQLNAEQWTPAQADRIADIVRWVNAVEGTPIQALPDSMAGRRGWGTHRLGISPWRVSGGQVWSNSTGKECPGNAKIAQLPAILAAARAPIAPPPPAPEDFMATMSDAEKALLMEMVNTYLPGNPGKHPAGPGWLRLDAVSNGIVQLLGRSSAVDPAQLATAIVDSIPDDLARQVADELGKRLNSPPAA